MELRYLDVPGPEAIETAFGEAGSWRADAFLLLQSPVFPPHRAQIVGLAATGRLPGIYSIIEFAAEGGLMCYGVSIPDLYRRAATYVDKILRGAKPADLPVEQPTKFDFVINLKTAQALGLTIPQSIMLQATEVIE